MANRQAVGFLEENGTSLTLICRVRELVAVLAESLTARIVSTTLHLERNVNFLCEISSSQVTLSTILAFQIFLDCTPVVRSFDF